MKYLFRTLLITVSGLLLSACGAKTTESVFPDNAAMACGAPASETRFIVHWEDDTFTVENDTSSESFRNGFVRDNLSQIRHVDPDFRVQIKNREPASSLNEQNDIHAASMNWGPQKISANQVWNQGVDGAGVTIGVIDGMVDTDHNQLASNIAINNAEIPNNGIDDDGNGFIDDYKGLKVNSETNVPSMNRHGTHVAGIVAADPDFGPVTGVAPKSKILSAQFIGNDGGGSIADAIVALNYVADRGVKIINMSWGLDACVQVPSLQSALQKLNARGILLVTAAGNGNEYGVGVNVDVTPSYPSAYNFSHQINVAASGKQNTLVSFSNYGANKVHVAAPGAGIYSTTPGNQVETMSGTSMATPMVSGVAALLWSAIPSASASQIKQAILRSVDKNPSSPLKVYSGGVINAYKALDELKTITGN